MKSKVAIVKCPDYNPEDLYVSIEKAINLLGGLKSFFKKDEKILVKPNLLVATSPDSGIITHPEFIRAMVKLLKSCGCKIFLGDSPSNYGYAERIDEVYEASGVKEIARQEDIQLVKFDRAIRRDGIVLTEWIQRVDGLVSLPKFKTHSITTLTAGIKNLFGLVPGYYKTEFHKQAHTESELAKILAKIYALSKPRLSIVDAIVALEGDGPANSGQRRNVGLILAGTDAVAVDSILTKIMGLEPEQVLTNSIASDMGLGVMDMDNIEVLGEKLQSCIIKDFKLPHKSIINFIPPVLQRVAKAFLNFRLVVDNGKCQRCGLCVKACPEEAIRAKEDKTIEFDYSKCLTCLCCQETCPYAAIRIKKSLLAKMLRM